MFTYDTSTAKLSAVTHNTRLNFRSCTGKLKLWLPLNKQAQSWLQRLIPHINARNITSNKYSKDTCFIER